MDDCRRRYCGAVCAVALSFANGPWQARSAHWTKPSVGFWHGPPRMLPVLNARPPAASPHRRTPRLSVANVATLNSSHGFDNVSWAPPANQQRFMEVSCNVLDIRGPISP
jgi:hypothetical protein